MQILSSPHRILPELKETRRLPYGTARRFHFEVAFSFSRSQDIDSNRLITMHDMHMIIVKIILTDKRLSINADSERVGCDVFALYVC